MDRSVADVIRQRYSCRTYLDTPIETDQRHILEEFLASLGTAPLGSGARIALVAATAQDRESLKGLGTYGVIKGATGFLVGAAQSGPKDLEDFGYQMERAVLRATDLGLETCWLGGSFSKSNFARKIGATRNERVPAVAAIGHAAEGSKATDRIRQRAGSSARLPSEQLFFHDRFGEPLTMDAAGAYAGVLELVRWAPSASNKQPWRIVRGTDGWHFYLQRSKGYGKGTRVFTLMRVADLQRVDMGIAMCHFELAARATGLAGNWAVRDPGLAIPAEGVEYTVSWLETTG